MVIKKRFDHPGFDGDLTLATATQGAHSFVSEHHDAVQGTLDWHLTRLNTELQAMFNLWKRDQPRDKGL